MTKKKENHSSYCFFQSIPFVLLFDVENFDSLCQTYRYSTLSNYAFVYENQRYDDFKFNFHGDETKNKTIGFT